MKHKKLLLLTAVTLIAATASANIEFRSTNPINFFNDIKMNDQQITHVAGPDAPGDVATKAYVDSQSGGSGGQLNLSQVLSYGNVANQSIDMAGNSLTNVGSCPEGYVKVPGSNRYGTSDFCVMKYEARKDSSGNAVSESGTQVWNNVDWNSAKDACQAQGDKYHLISEKEWMTITENVVRQPENWADDTVGSRIGNGGGLYSGNTGNDNSVAYDDSGNPDSGTSYEEKRTLQLSNGNEVWDLSGNVREWTDEYIYSSEEANNHEAKYHYRSFRAPYDGSDTWSGSSYQVEDYGLGGYYYSSDGRAVYRGGAWTNGRNAGVLHVNMGTSSRATSGLGFRCSYSVS